MEHYREYLDRFYVCSNRMDGLYYLAARHLGVNENTFSLLYSLADGRPRSQKQLSEELLIPKTTVNTMVKECIQAGLEGGSEYFLIEQDDTYGRDPFDSLRISRDNLIAMGYGDWF